MEVTVEKRKVISRPGSGRRKADSPQLPPISPDESLSIERRVYTALRMALMVGSVAPGQGLSSRSLSAALGVSPTPVREALKRLEADGALISKNKSAFFVNDPDQADFAEILEVRINLEGLAIRAAARHARERDLVALRRLNSKYEKMLAAEAVGGTRSLVPNFEFHFEIYKLSGSRTLVNMIETLWLRIGPTLHRYVATHHDKAVRANFHKYILTALACHDEDSAARALQGDLRAAADEIMPQLRPRAHTVSLLRPR